MTKPTAKIKEIIVNLLAKARSTDNEHEAAAFLAKANEMLERYQLSSADLADADDPIINHPGLKHAESGHAWRWKLYSALGQYYGCKSIHCWCLMTNEDGTLMKDKKGRYIEGYEQRLVGRESAIITTDLMYPWIVSQIRAHAKRIAAEVKVEIERGDWDGYYKDEIPPQSEQGQAKRVAAALIERIKRLTAEQRMRHQAAPTTEAGKNALIITDQVLAKYKECFPNAETMRSRDGKTDGRARDAAGSIGLHRQTGGAGQLRLGAK